ncbi:hypothetical protein HLB44_35185 [Aquincola sp. S2]|uniref:SWIM-type domain-containing protein n=1 Tax=Pseudaquabacterium terrae TaxID=2732868 RepID=A0ABX2EU19_9BURK|nr:hypothetical protein [Aquabacterium terrae]NRF72242.1 hypothetical protein [Aquabacterium terrae]
MTAVFEPERDEVVLVLAAALSDSVLRRVSNSTVFVRGETCAASGAVEVASEELGTTPTIRAIVVGSEPYRTEVWIHEGVPGGDCTCAHAQDGSFCKHQVALALVWRERLIGAVSSIDEEGGQKGHAGVRHAQTELERRETLKDFLHGRSAAVLADRLLDLADRDDAISRELHQWRKLTEEPHDIADLKALVTDIMSSGTDYITWREGYGYTRRAEAVLPLLAQTRERDPTMAFVISLHAMRRGWAVLMQADDSDGDIGGLIKAIGAEWVTALEQAGPQPAAFGDTYLQLVLEDPFGCFDSARAEAAMGAAALGRYRSAIAARWRAAKDAVLAARAEHAAQVAKAEASRKRAPHLSRDTERDVRLWTLERLHLQQLEAAGDIDGALAVMREDMSEQGSYHQGTAFLEKHGRLSEAFANAQQGYEAFPGDAGLQEDLLRCYDRDGQVHEAFVLRRKRFDDAPSVDRYNAVVKAGAADGQDADALRAELQAVLVKREDQALVQNGTRPTHWRPGAPRRANATCRCGRRCS